MTKRDLAAFAEETHKITAKLMALVPDDALDWRSADTEDWWTTGQLMYHLTYSTGGYWKGVQFMQGFETRRDSGVGFRDGIPVVSK